MSRPIEVSVVLPVRNGETYLGAAIASILSQSLESIELVVVDDNSTDGSVAIAEAASIRDDRVRVLESPGSGIVVALTTGVASSTAPLIARMDADDVSLPRRLELQHAFLEARPAVALVGGFVDVIDPQGGLLRSLSYPTEPAEIDRRILDEVCFASPTMVFRRNAFDDVGGFRRLFEPAEDADLALRLAERYQVANLAEAVVRYRVHNDNVSVSRLRGQTQALLVARAASRARRDGRRLSFESGATLDELQSELGVPGTMIDEQSFEAALTWSELVGQAGLASTSDALLEQAGAIADSLGAAGNHRARIEETRMGARERVRDGSVTPEDAAVAAMDGEVPSTVQTRVSSRISPQALAAVRNRLVRIVYLAHRGSSVLLAEGPRAFVSRVLGWRRSRRPAPSPRSSELVVVDTSRHDRLEAQLPERHGVEPPDLSVVIAVWNALDYAQACVTSIYEAASSRSFEVIVVDNGSGPDVLEWLRTEAARIPAFGYVRLPENVGFARGMNVGVRLSRGRHVVLLNSDTLVTDGWSDLLVDALESDRELGLVSPVTNYVGEGDQIDEEARSLHPADAAGYARSIATRDEIVVVPERIAFFCVAFRRELFDRLNGLDEGFGLGNFEDEDFCLRTQMAGQRIGVLRSAFVYHHGSKTFEVNRVDHSEWMVRNLDRYIDKMDRACAVRPIVPRPRSTRATVSVITRTRNRPHALETALNSLAWQTFRDFEVVVVNDGGADVQPLISQYDGDLRIRYLANDPGRGPAQAANDGVEAAEGRYITFLDDDDLVYPFHLASLVRAAEQIDPTSAFVYSHYNRALVTGQGGTTIVVDRIHMPVWEFDRRDLLVQNRPPLHTWLYSRALFERFGGFDPSFAILKDWDFLLRVTEHLDLVGIPRETCEYRIGLDLSNSVTGSRGNALEELRRIYERYPCDTAGAALARRLELAGVERQVASAEALRQAVESGLVSREIAARRYLADVFGFPAPN